MHLCIGFAAEGTEAHELCEYKLRQALGMEAKDPTENLTWFNEEMADCASGYAAYILEQVEAAKQNKMQVHPLSRWRSGSL